MKHLVAVFFLFASGTAAAQAPDPPPTPKPSFWDFLRKAPVATILSTGDIATGLKEALHQGTRSSVQSLGRDGGFLDNVRVRIPLPDKLRPVEKGLRALKQDKAVDDFVGAMNHAAEKAVPKALAIFGDAIRAMTIDDARAILKGQPDAATQFFRRGSESRLTEAFLPIVMKATNDTGVSSAYKGLIRKAGPLGRLAGRDAGDLDGYVTGKAIDGLFLLIADEEKRIREDPAARTTSILKKVFGSAKP